MKRLWHRIEHYFGWNKGDIHVQTIDGRTFVGFICLGCGEFSGVDDVTTLRELDMGRWR